MALKVDDLQVFAQVMNERSVSSAAAKLFLTQQAVSEKIRTMERLLGTDLFIRSSKGMEPTPAGYRLLPYAEKCIELVDEGMRRARETPDLQVEVQANFASTAAPLLERGLARHRFAVSRHEGSTEEIIEAVAEGRVDLAVGPARHANEHVEILPFFNDPLVCAVSPDSPLIDQGTVRLEDLAPHHVVIDIWDPVRNGLVEKSSVDHLVQTLEASPGAPGRDDERVVICARSGVIDQVRSGQLVELRVADLPLWSVPVHLAYRTSDAERLPIRALQEAMLDIGLAPVSGRRSDAERAAVL